MDVFEKIKIGIDECEIKIDNSKIENRKEARRQFGLCIVDYRHKILKNLTKEKKIDEVLKYKQDEEICSYIYNYFGERWFTMSDPEDIKDSVKVGDINYDDVDFVLNYIYKYLILEEMHHHPKTKWKFERT